MDDHNDVLIPAMQDAKSVKVFTGKSALESMVDMVFEEKRSQADMFEHVKGRLDAQCLSSHPQSPISHKRRSRLTQPHPPPLLSKCLLFSFRLLLP